MRAQAGSLPTRERGLKFMPKRAKGLTEMVAPYTGAWIEIHARKPRYSQICVAPYTGAWIEIVV